ncbi:MAG: ATP synthase F1 subunit epsilon [Pseudomonadota bacterium]
MAETLTFELVSPERKLASTEAEAVTIPGAMGDLTAMAHHAPFLTTLRPGYVVVASGSDRSTYFVTGGFAEISDNTVSVLAEEAFEASVVDAAWLDSRISSAEEALPGVAADRVQAEQQRINDLRAIREQVGA